MLPKDLLIDLEKGDRTMEHLKMEDNPKQPLMGIASAMTNMVLNDQLNFNMALFRQQMDQYAGLQQFGQAGYANSTGRGL